MAMALGVTASAYAANPFSDVPANSWAYDAVNKLAAEGIIDGYPNGTFGGDRLMTRYEMAQIVAKAMAKGANVDRPVIIDLTIQPQTATQVRIIFAALISFCFLVNEAGTNFTSDFYII